MHAVTHGGGISRGDLRRLVATAGSVAALLGSVAGCTEDEADLDTLAEMLTKDAAALVDLAESVPPADHEGPAAEIVQRPDSDIPCGGAQEGQVKRRVKVRGVFGSSSVQNTATSLLGLFADYDASSLDTITDTQRLQHMHVSNESGELSFEIIVREGDPVTWRAIGTTVCVEPD